MEGLNLENELLGIDHDAHLLVIGDHYEDQTSLAIESLDIVHFDLQLLLVLVEENSHLVVLLEVVLEALHLGDLEHLLGADFGVEVVRAVHEDVLPVLVVLLHEGGLLDDLSLQLQEHIVYVLARILMEDVR